MPVLEGSTEIEVVRDELRRGLYRFAIFDFDGTISLIREGWREIMIPMMVEILVGLREGETEDQVETIVADFVDDLTGQQTIFQMMRLVEEVETRDGDAQTAAEYKSIFNDRLLAHIEGRIADLESGQRDPDEMLIPGSLPFLEELRSRGLDLYLASGTDHEYVQKEAKLLGIDRYFNGGMFGALENVEDFSKAKLIAEILEKNQLDGERLLGFGDGYVEIENVSDVGGTAVGVASNEQTRTGINEWKRERLVKAGAALIVPHYLELDPLLNYLFP